MNKQTELMLVEEFSDLELEAISGGANNSGLIVVSVEDNEIVKNVNVAVNAAAAIVALGGRAGAVAVQ